MQNVFFWINWDKPERLIYQFFLFIFIITLVFYFYAYWVGEGSVIHWEVQTMSQQVEHPVDEVDLGLIKAPVAVNANVLFKQFAGSDLEINTRAALAFVIILGVCVALALTVITYLPRFWYITGMIIFILFIINFRFENLMVFGSIKKWPTIIAFFLFLPLSYYFHAIKTGLPLVVRLLSFAGAVLLFSIVLGPLSEVPNPQLFIANYGFFGLLLITVVFILMISHEIVNGFLYVITRSPSREGKSMRHFLIITTLYLGILTILYINRLNVITWDLYFLDLYVLFAVSAVIGIWGLITRSRLLENILPFKPLGALMYLALATISMATIAYLTASGNDPILRVVRDIILYAHMGFGFIFFVYVISNFGQLLSQDFKVYKIVYDPKVMPYFTFRLAGIITAAAFFLQANYKVHWYNALSGYYNGIGDTYITNNDKASAWQYYKEGSDYGVENHRSNYALAKLEVSKDNLSNGIEFYNKSIQRRPTPYAYANLANIYVRRENFFESVFTLEKGLENFPDNGPLLNNLGLALSQTSIIDSALYYFHLSSRDPVVKDNAGINYFALAARENLSMNTDSLVDLYIDKRSIEFYSNALLASNIPDESEFQLDMGDSIMNINRSTYLTNYLINHRYSFDSLVWNWANKVKNISANFYANERISLAQAITLYYSGFANQAFRNLDYMAHSSFGGSGKYFDMLGLWSMEHGAYDLSERNFNYGINSGHRDAYLHKAIAQLEQAEFDEARRLLAILNAGGDTEIAGNLLEAASIRVADSVKNKDPVIQYYYYRYNLPAMSHERRDTLLTLLENQDLKARILADLSFKMILASNLSEANFYYKRLNGLRIVTPEVIRKARLIELLILALEGSRDLLIRQYEAYIRDYGVGKLEIYYMPYIEWIATGEPPPHHQIVSLGSNPFFPPGVFKSLNYLNEMEDLEDPPAKPYDLIVEAVEVNKTSIPLKKAYVLQCAREGYTNYGSQTLEALKEVLPEREFEELSNMYEKIITEDLTWEISEGE